MGVAVGGQNLEHAVAQLEDGDIEGTAAEVIYGHFHILVLLVQSVCQCGSGGLVDDTLHVQTGDAAGLLGGLTLRVGEIGRDSDDGFRNLLAQIFFRRLLHLLKNHGRYLLRRVELAVDVHAGGVVLATDHLVGDAVHLGVHLVVRLTHETLDGEHGVVRIGDGLTLGRRADFAFSAVGESHHGRGGALPLVVDDDGRLIAFHHCDAGISGSQVDTDNLSHSIQFFKYFLNKFFALTNSSPQQILRFAQNDRMGQEQFGAALRRTTP